MFFIPFILLIFSNYFSSFELYDSLSKVHFGNYDLKYFELGYLSYKVIRLFIFIYFQPILMAVVTQFSKSKAFN